ncbi:MAG: U32 family peptidase, partial [Bacilli bacterium]|nr:U32 family peptidase [Bacilli bacterium]
LIEEYKKEYGTHPNLELIVYGKSKIMHTMYCPLKRLGMCPKCKTSSFALKDEYASFPLMFNDDCTISLLNSKVTNIMDNLEDLKGINYYRLVFTTETEEEVRNIIESFQEKLDGSDERLFNEETDTRGHFFKNPL